MTLTIENRTLSALQADLELLFIQNKDIHGCEDSALLQAIGFEGNHGSSQLLPEKRRFYIGLEKFDANNLQIAAANAVKALKKFKYTSVKASSSPFDAQSFKAFCEGLILGDYEFTHYKSKKEPTRLAAITFAYEGTQFSDFETALTDALAIAAATNFTRDLVNTTPDDLYPLQMAKIAKDLASEYKLDCDIMDEAQFLDEGMEAIYMVGRASRHNSQLIHLSYKPKNPKKVISLVGKGLTYDSGGLSLKPADSMLTMKMDKAGACAVLGIIKAAAQLQLPIEIHGFIGAVENMIGGDAYKPDDVLTAKNGTTIEVRNTDAEGRLVLADVLCYAQEKVKPDYIFDYATLTGACVVALGLYSTGVMGHNEELKASFALANRPSGELTGALPFNDHLKEELKSEVADIKNVTGRWGGALTAGLFLDHFIEEENKEKWIHFDIAGPAYTEKPWGVHGYGGTGAGVRLTLAWMQELCKA